MNLRELFESSDFNLVDLIKKDAKQYLSESRKVLFRGLKSVTGLKKAKFGDMDVLYTVIQARTNRRPLNTNRETHDIIDSWFLEVFGWRARSEGTFATGNLLETLAYGDPYAFVPLHNFKFVWSNEIHDLYLATNEENFDDFNNDFDDDDDEGDLQSFIEGVLNNGSYRSTDLNAAIESKHEIMFRCDSYLIFKPMNYVLAKEKSSAIEKVLKEL